MATRQKTVEFAFPTNVATLATDTRRDFAAITLYLPENSKVFRSVVIEATVADGGATATTLVSWLMGIKLGAVAFSDATVSDSLTNSGEKQTYRFTRDVTSYFTTNWTGTSMTSQVGLTLSGGTVANTCAKLIITYDYDDTTTTHVKTIRIPIESTRTLLTTSQQTVGGATAIPAIGGGYLPEASAVVRQVWIEAWGNEATVAVTDFTASLRINGGAANSWWFAECALNSACWAYGIVDITAVDLTAARSLEMILTGVTSRMNNVGGMVCVTYEFNSSTTTTVYNSCILGGLDTWGCIGDADSADAEVWERDFTIMEPETITLKESAAFLFGQDDAAFAIEVNCGAQSPRTITFTGGTLQCGQFSVVHRIDAGGAAGAAGITIFRDKNVYNIKVRSTTVERGWNFNGFAIINYTSGKASAGVGAHNHSIYHHLANTAADVLVKQTASSAPAIPETSYWVNSVVFNIAMMTSTAANTSVVLNAKKQTGEGEGAGWEPVYAGSARSGDLENQLCTTWCSPRRTFKRFPDDFDPLRLDVETSRAYKVETNPLCWVGVGMWVTYYAITATFSGNVTGSDGGTVQIHLFDGSVTTQVLLKTTRIGNGSYSVTWYDDWSVLFAVMYEDAQNVGMSVGSEAVLDA